MLAGKSGDLISRFFFQPAIGVFLAVLCSASASSGQALDLTFDFNTPASHSLPFSDVETQDVNAGVAFSLGYFSRTGLAKGRPLRMGLVAGRQELTVKPIGSTGSGSQYSAFIVQGRADLRFFGNDKLSLSGGMAVGLSFISDSAPCNEMFCELPESLVLVTPSLRMTVRLSSRMSALVVAKGSVYMYDRSSTFPYQSGAILAVGLEFSAGRRSTED